MLNLKNIMRANAISCLLFGALFVLLPGPVAHFLGGPSSAPHIILFGIGLVLIVNAVHLVWASRASLPKKTLIVYFSGGDLIWVIASISLLVFEFWITTPHGKLATIVVAVMVSVFGIMQITKIKEIQSENVSIRN